MKKLLMTSVAAATAFAMAPTAMAQDTDVEVELTAEQQAMYDGWTVANRTAYDAWPADVQEYYWTLTPPQTRAWWQLNDEQRVAIFNMSTEQRAATWKSISQQMNQRSETARVATSTSAETRTTTPRYQSGEVLQTTPASTRAKGEYPICRGDQQDSCIQPRAAGKNWGNRPLDYWPGKPASEIPGKKPQSRPNS